MAQAGAGVGEGMTAEEPGGTLLHETTGELDREEGAAINSMKASYTEPFPEPAITVPDDLRRTALVTSVDYVLNEWRALEHIIEGARLIDMADDAANGRDRSLHLDLAKKELDAAKALSDRRRNTAASTPTPDLHWDLTGTDGPVAVFRHSDIDYWLNIIAEKTSPNTD